MIKRMIVMLVAAALVLGSVAAYKFYTIKKTMAGMAAMANPPQTVSTTKVGLQDWQNELKVVGTLRAVKGADLSAEVSGTVESLSFDSGQDVAEGATLVHLRSADDEAKLQALEASLRLAQITLDRDTKQIKAQAISQATYDADAANLESLKAQVAQQKALLDKKTIRAPFAGQLGIRQVDIGQYLSPGSPVVTLQQLAPIYLDFAIPQQDLPAVQVGQKITAETDAFPGAVFEGEITAINPKVEESTRNVDIRAAFPNENKSLRPGMFATAHIKLGDVQHFLTLPQTAISYNPYGNTVFIAHDKGGNKVEAEMAFVTTGLTRGDQVAVLSGIKEGDVIVTSGQLKLRNGTPLIVNNNLQPADDPNPKPKDE